MIKAKLINVGRNKINKEVKVKDEKALHKEIGKHILSKGWGMDQVGDNIWAITSGWMTVGKVEIISES